MSDAPLRVEDEPDQRLVALLDDRLYEFNVSRTGKDDGRWLAIFVRDDREELVAGLHGWTWGGCLHIRTLWVQEARRRQGWGSRLLRAAEAEGIRRGCVTAELWTLSFQAPGFYRRHGWEPTAELEGYFAGHTRLQFRKRLVGQEA